MALKTVFLQVSSLQGMPVHNTLDRLLPNLELEMESNEHHFMSTLVFQY